MKTREATKEYYEARQKVANEMKKQYRLSQKQIDTVFHSYVSIERIQEICNFQLSKEKFEEFFNEVKVERINIISEEETLPEWEVQVTINWNTGDYDSFIIKAKDLETAQADAIDECISRGYDTDDLKDVVSTKVQCKEYNPNFASCLNCRNKNDIDVVCEVVI